MYIPFNVNLTILVAKLLHIVLGFFFFGLVWGFFAAAFLICSLYCTLGYLFLTFHFENKSPIKAELGKVKSRFAYRNRHKWMCDCTSCGVF